MYRDSVDNDFIFTLEDVILFEGSPFASWMERLTLEYPEHQYSPDITTSTGILQDDREPIIPVQWDSLGLSGKQIPPPRSEKSAPSNNSLGTATRAGIAEALGRGGKNVQIIEPTIDESQRRKLTLDAMRDGADFIVNGQLFAGRLSGLANLLMRTSGNSELGDYLYTACDTRSESPSQSAFLLCFQSDLLQDMQGQLPPKMLHIRNGVHLTSLQTEEQMAHYLPVKQRFLIAQNEFCSDETPNPVHSSHFGRWSNCAKKLQLQGDTRTEGETPTPIKSTQNAPQPGSPIHDASDSSYSGETESALKSRQDDSILLPSNASLTAPPASLRNPAAPEPQTLQPDPEEPIERNDSDETHRTVTESFSNTLNTSEDSTEPNSGVLATQSGLPNASLSAPPASLRNPAAAQSHPLQLEPEELTHSLVDHDEVHGHFNGPNKKHQPEKVVTESFSNALNTNENSTESSSSPV